MSWTWQNDRVWVPSPWTSSGVAGDGGLHEAGDDHPVLALWRGPTVLKNRAMTQSSPRSWWYPSARNSSIAFESA